jgi:uncharacterized ion transporter superfamily protein YfcC
MFKKIPHTYTILVFIIFLCALLSWIVPAGEYSRQTVEVNGSARTIIVNGSFHNVEQSPQSWQIFTSLLSGFERQAGIIAFLLIIGGAFQIMNKSRAIDTGIYAFLRYAQRLERHPRIKKIGVHPLIITLVIFLFSLFGAVFGMSEETLAFVLIVVPLAVSMGYDSITGLCMVYVAAHVGFAGAVLNPFTIGIAQGLSDLPLFSGFEYRLCCWFLLTATLTACVLLYARRVKKNPQSSPVYRLDAYWRDKNHGSVEQIHYATPRSTWLVYGLILLALSVFSVCYPKSCFSFGNTFLTGYITPILTLLFAVFGLISARKSHHFFVLTLLAFTILFLITGVMGHGWYLPEISGIFLAMGILAGFASGGKTNEIIKLFLDGAKDMLPIALVVGLAGGIIEILEQGKVIDPILHALSSLLDETGKTVSIGVMYAIQTLINIIIPSGSAKAALTMPVMAPFSDVIGLSRQATVMAFQFGDGFTNMIIPTSPVLMGALGIARIPYEVWIKWFFKILLLFVVLGFLLLLPTVWMQLPGF